MKSEPATAPLFSPFKAAIVAALWGPVPIAIYVLANGFLGHALLNVIQRSIVFAMLSSFSFWLLAYLLRDKPRWWRMRVICPLIVLVVFFVTVLVVESWRGLPIQIVAALLWHHGITSLIPRESFFFFALISLVAGIPASFGAARYYRKTHPPNLHSVA